ncbi:MAG: AhpC/TSA family protein [Solobacterium sp.]|nr:AhpC/TSA family protein [Solobacterium sp.]MBQ6356380.1 AhpC/TSA family protein [Solobacterium sp.]MBQ6533354.1 AhpC/TSA family protein [Solobacterium sp.]
MKLKTGDRFPEMTFRTVFEDNVTTGDVLTGTTVFWVLRYIGCPVCRLDIHDIAAHIGEFKDRNARVYVVLQSDQEHMRQALQETPLPLEFICDPEMEFYRQLEIRPARNMRALAGNIFRTMAKLNAARKRGLKHGDYEGNEQQLPALFIVAGDGTVQYAHYAADLADMPSVKDVLAFLDRLAAKEGEHAN